MSIYHIHHIVPRHMGGTDESSNLIKLTVKDHAEAHRKLWEEYGNEYDLIAWKCLSGQIDSMEATVLATKVANTGKTPWNKGKKGVQSSTRKGIARSEEEKKLISEGTKKGMLKTTKKIGAPKGTIPWNKGHKKGGE